MATKQRKLLGSHMVVDPEICHSKPTYPGTRILVALVMKEFANSYGSANHSLA